MLFKKKKKQMDFKRARNGEWRENEIRFGAEYWEIWRQIDDEARVETKGKIPFDFQRGERGALDQTKTNHDCVSIATEKPRFRSVFTSPVGVRGRQGKIGGPGKQSHGYVSARGLKIRSIPRFLRFFSTVESKPRDPI